MKKLFITVLVIGSILFSINASYALSKCNCSDKCICNCNNECIDKYKCNCLKKENCDCNKKCKCIDTNTDNNQCTCQRADCKNCK